MIIVSSNCALDLLNKSRIGIKLRFRIRNEVWPQHSCWHIPKLNHSTIYHFFTFYVFLFVLTCVAVIGNNCTCKSFEACFIISIYYIKKVFRFVKSFLTVSRKKFRKYYILPLYTWMIYFYMKNLKHEGNFSIVYS